MTKYDWSNVPKEVKWIATDVDGITSGWKEKPKYKQIYGTWDRSDWSKANLGFIKVLAFRGNWQDSLEERPHDNSN